MYNKIKMFFCVTLKINWTIISEFHRQSMQIKIHGLHICIHAYSQWNQLFHGDQLIVGVGLVLVVVGVFRGVIGRLTLGFGVFTIVGVTVVAGFSGRFRLRFTSRRRRVIGIWRRFFVVIAAGAWGVSGGIVVFVVFNRVVLQFVQQIWRKGWWMLVAMETGNDRNIYARVATSGDESRMLLILYYTVL